MGSMSASKPLISDWVAGFWRLQQWPMSSQQLLSFVKELLELGVSTVDHAMVYRSEAIFGRALAIESSIRQNLQIVTKCGIRPCGFGALGAQRVNHYDSSAKAIIESTEASLNALNTDYIDVLLLHRPDYLMDVNEVAEAFSQLQNAGKVRAFGVSNFSTHQFESLSQVWPQLVTNQIEFSPRVISQLDSGLFEQCQRNGIRPMLWSCLAGGELLQPVDARGHRILAQLRQVAEEVRAVAVEQVVYAWVRQLPCKPIPLLGSKNIERIRVAIESSQIQLSREQWYGIWEAANGAAVP